MESSPENIKASALVRHPILLVRISVLLFKSYKENRISLVIELFAVTFTFRKELSLIKERKEKAIPIPGLDGPYSKVKGQSWNAFVDN